MECLLAGPGLPLEILAQEFWVPGSQTRAEAPQFIGKDIFREILATTDAAAVLYAQRASEDCVESDSYQYMIEPNKECVI